MLRAELANRLAERLRIEERLLRDELERTAREKQREMSVRPEVEAAQFRHGVKLLLRACLEHEELADEFATDVIESGDCEGLVGEGVFRRIVEARRRGEKIDVAQLVGALDPAERRLVYESLFWEGSPPDRESARGYRLALRREKAERERAKTQSAIKATEDRQEQIRLGQEKLKKEAARRLSQSPPRG
jgi:hypothetical protein